MLNVKQIRDRIIELDAKHRKFFEASKSSTLSFIDIKDNKATFKTGIIIDHAVWQDINEKLEIGDKL